MRYLLLCLTLALATPALAEPWRVVGDAQFAPYSFLPIADDTPRVLDVELIETVLRAAGVDYALRLYPWQRSRRMLDRSGAEMAFQFAGTAERLQRGHAPDAIFQRWEQ